MCGPTHLIFGFSDFSIVFPYELLKGQPPLLRLRFPGYSMHACLVHPWYPFCQLYLPWVFVGVSAVPSLGALGHVFLKCPWPSLARFLSALQVLSWWPYPDQGPPISLIHWLGVLNLLGFSFWCHLGLWFIVCFHCGGFNRTSLDARLIGASLTSLVLICCLFYGASMALLLYLQSSERVCGLAVLSKYHLLLLYIQLSLVLPLLSIGGVK